RRRLRELELLRELSHTLRQCESPSEVLPKLLQYTLDTFAVADGAAWEIDHLRQRAVKVASRGWGEAMPHYVNLETAPLASFLQTHDPHEVSLAELLPEAGTASHAFLIPVLQEHMAKGFLVVAIPTPDAFEPLTAYLRFAASFADIAGIAIHRLELRAETFRRLRQLETLHHIDVTIASSMEKKLTSEILLRECAVQLEADGGFLWSFDEASQQLFLLHSFGFSTQQPTTLAKSVAPELLTKVLQTRQEVFSLGREIPDSHGRPLLSSDGTPFLGYAGFPLIAKGRLLGVLELLFARKAEFPAHWTEFARVLAGQATIALENAQMFSDLKQLNKRLQQACEEILASWARTLDMRDHETENHSLRVAELAVMVAEKLGLASEQLANLRRGALLHDLGKIAIPDAILLKPSPLTDEEWQIMRKHPLYARSMIEPITFLRNALAIPLYHHERYDGTGYPHGLVGEQIPIEARIFAVVDVWDALTSDRPYRPAWPQEKALEYIREQAGKHFDPRVVEAFLHVIKETDMQPLS
ncbi:MAG: HD domain-containing protein, partial [Candidatus Sumerlaeaceae bacterium]|nr:HD domain-containing protein [Candidatus Sumerlaeaceae bacterium]